MPIIDVTRYGACPFCGCRQLRHDRIPPDRVAIWCGCGASFDMPQGNRTYEYTLNVLLDRWYRRHTLNAQDEKC